MERGPDGEFSLTPLAEMFHIHCWQGSGKLLFSFTLGGYKLAPLFLERCLTISVKNSNMDRFCSLASLLESILRECAGKGMVQNNGNGTKLVKASLGCPNRGGGGGCGKISATPAAWERPATSSEIPFLGEKPTWIQTSADLTALTNRVNQESDFHVGAGGGGLEFLEREGVLLLPRAGETGEGRFGPRKLGKK